MRLVRMSDLTEKERKKALEEQRQRLEENRKVSEQTRIDANNKFNDLINKKGSFDTNKHTTTIEDLRKAYKNTPNYNVVRDSLNNYYKQHKSTSLWDEIQHIAGNNTYDNSNNTKLMFYNSQPNEAESFLEKMNQYIYGNNLNFTRERKKQLEDSKNKDILQNKEQNNIFSLEKKQLAPIKTESNIQKKNDSIWEDVADTFKLTELGVSSGFKNVFNYVENANENNFNNYKIIKEQQFLTSPNVSEEDKSIAKSQNNLLLQKNVINTEQTIETNLVKKAINDSINKDEEEIENIKGQISNKGMQKLSEIAPSMGQMIPGAVLGTVNPVLSTSYFTTSSGGSYIRDAKDRGMDDKQAFKYGTIMGALEGASESFITGQQVNKISKAFGGKQISKKILDSYGFNMFENVVQEAVMEPAQELTAEAIGGKDKADWTDIGSRMLESGFNGALMGAITNGVTYGLEKSANVYNKVKNKENVTPKEYKEALQENINKFGEKAVEENIRKGALETYQELNSIVPDNANLKNVQEKVENQSTQETNDNIANDKQLLYNANESEGGNDGEIQGLQRLSGQFDSNIFEEGSKQETRKYTREEYENWEKSIQPKDESKFTNEQSRIINNTKRQYNKDIVFFDGDNNQNYISGASLNDKRKIYIDEKIAKDFGTDRVINHEIMESDIRHNRKLSNDIIKPTIEKIIEDPNFQKQKETFWEKESDEMPSDYAIAKEILCDRFAEMKTGESLDYDNILSKETNMTIDYSLENFHKQLYNRSINEDLVELQTAKDISNIQTKTTSYNLPLSENTKVRKHYKSIMQSLYTSDEARQISKELMGTDTYVPESNEKQMERANKRIEIAGPDSELSSLMARASTGGNIKADDIAVGERLIQYYSKIGNKEKLQDAIQATAMAGTTAGQTVQAMSLLNHQTPEGQAIWLQRSVEKMNNDLKKARGEKAEQFDLTKDMIDKIVKSNGKQELEGNLDEVYKELGQQVTKTTLQKIDAWRYFAMLANPKTHVRNVLGNTAMAGTQKIKNKLAGTIEGIVSKVNPNMERTHTIVPASKEVKKFAKGDIKNVADRLGMNENKYNPKTRLENSMRTFKSNAMEYTVGKLFDLNDKLLEAEDGFGLKHGYVKALSEYMTANKLKPDNITDQQLAKARNYAVEQAQEATFHQASNIATLLNQLQNKNKFAKLIMDSTLPFKKTPVNVAKAGLEYSPIGLAKSIIYDSVQLRKGNITVNKYIDNLSKGLTGTGIALVGYALAKSGFLKASGDEDKDKEKYDQERGSQNYSVKIGDNTYSLDWLAPSGIPLFIGAECFEISKNDKETKTSSNDDDTKYSQVIKSATNILDSFTNAMNPMTEMSMLSGLTSALKSYEQGSSQFLASMGTNAVKSYVNQFVPTALGQIARTTDDYERNTSSTKSGVLPRAIDTTKNQIMNKVPGLRQKLPIRTDIWGNDIKQTDNKIERGLENAVVPWTRKNVESTEVDKALTDLYNKIGENSILPKDIGKTLTINGNDYRLTNEEYNNYKKQYGATSYNLIKDLVSSKDYKNMNDKQKQKAIEEVYSYAKEKNKVDYAKNNDEKLETSTNYKVLEDLKQNGGNQSSYLNYIAKTDGLKKDKEKNEILVNANYDKKTKSIIYRNTTGSEDELYNNVLEKNNIDINEYLKYKQQEFESDKKDDGTLSGKSISGSKKKKVYNYVNNMNITYEQRLAILGKQYKLNNSEQMKLYSFINTIPNQNKEKKLDIFSKYSLNFEVYKNGTIKLK